MPAPPASAPEIRRRPVANLQPLRKPARRVKFLDRLAANVIRFGGAMVILAVAAIFVFIGREALPLFLPAKAKPVVQAASTTFAAESVSGVLGVDEYETYAYWLHPTGALRVVTLPEFKPRADIRIPKLQTHPLSAAYRSPSRDHLYLGTRDGHLLLAQVKFTPDYTEQGRTVTAKVDEEKLIRLSEEAGAVTRVYGRHDGAGRAYAVALCADGRVYLVDHEDGGETKVEPLPFTLEGQPTLLARDGDGRKLFVATDTGKLYHWSLDESREKPSAVLTPGDGTKKLTTMEFVIGNNALLLGFDDGSLEQWFGVREKDDDVARSFRKIRSFEPMSAPVVHLQPSGRDKGFVAGARDGTVKLYFTTSERTLLTVRVGGELSGLCYSPKLTGILAATSDQRATFWEVQNPHPEISRKTLFGKVWYEGYDRPDYVWQSTGGTDDFESKFSLVPLTLGTLKGAFYGLLFAIPVAVMAALYVSQFVHFRIRALVKPTVEIMAALPSVVIGFLAGLWLAPMLENHVLSVAAMFVVAPLLILLAVTAWHHVPLRLRSRLPHGMELALIVPLVAFAFLIAVNLGPRLELWLFHGDFRQWVFNVFGEQFEQRNSIVIGFAMGFAVIPIIFTISEDALSNVPQHFISGSLALGASRWQTATRIILPTASPGIFSAIMVGFGRAVGETMIVLMATGNTPILSFSPFNGMRTLSANIAVEIPEAPVGGTLYRVLFLAAILLFLMTFLVNTVAEIIRQRLRQKYQAV
jgi:phosphate transport system permease protein